MKVVGSTSDSDGHPRRRRRRLRSLAFVPTLITLGNLLCGFAAIHFCMRAMYGFGAGVAPTLTGPLGHPLLERMLPSFLSVGAGLVFFGMVLDCFDGLVARMTRSTTNFGGQLDSLADMVTFGAAPAALMVAFMTKELAGDSIVPSPISDHFLGRATWMAAALYVAMAAVRLARFNVEHADADADHRTFRGMPSPAAAAILVALILFQDQFRFEERSLMAWIRGALVVGTPILTAAVAILMVSRVPYRRLHRVYLAGRQPVWQVLVFMLVVVVFVSSPSITLLAMTILYGISGPLHLVVRRFRAGAGHAPSDSADTTPRAEKKSSA